MGDRNNSPEGVKSTTPLNEDVSSPSGSSIVHSSMGHTIISTATSAGSGDKFESPGQYFKVDLAAVFFPFSCSG